MEFSFGSLIRKFFWYLVPFILFWVFSAVMLGMFGYEGSFLLMNSHFHHPITDFMGRYLTHLADVILLPMLLLALAWKRDKAAAPTALLLMILTGLVAQSLKMFVFDDWMRPPVVCAGVPDFICLLESPPRHHAFPSGHATTFAAGGLVFAWLVKDWKPWFQLGVGLFTVSLCYTRVHIGVHFLGDIFVGSIIGAILGLILFKFIYPVLQKLFARIPEGKLDSFGVWIMFLGGIFFTLRYIQLMFF